MNWANFITLIRFILIPIISYLLLASHDYKLLAGSLFAVSALTDFLDGYIARKYNMVTKIGRILDPLADKLTLIAVYIILTYNNTIPTSVGVILFTREILVFLTTSTFYLKGIDLVFPSKVGKFSAFLLYISAVANILNIQPLGLILAVLAVIFSIYSALSYLVFAYKSLSKNN